MNWPEELRTRPRRQILKIRQTRFLANFFSSHHPGGHEVHPRRHLNREVRLSRAAPAARGPPHSPFAHQHRHLDREVRLARAALAARGALHSAFHHLHDVCTEEPRLLGGCRGSSTAADLYLAVTHATHFSYLQSRHRAGTAGAGPSPLRSRPFRQPTWIQTCRK